MDNEAARPEDDFAAQLTHRLDQLVSLLRDRSVRPVVTACAIAIVVLAGVIVAIGVVVALGVSLITLFNTVVFDGRVWATYFLFGGILCAGGLFLLLMSLRARREDAGS